MLATLAGCQRTDSAESGGSSRSVEPQQLLTVGAGEDEFVIDINRDRLGMYPLNASICEPLVRLTHDFRVEPWLATRWEYGGDNTFRFTLRRGVRFHDGRLLTAAAVKYTLDRTGTRLQHTFLGPESVRVVDDTTVDVRPTRPNLRLVEQLVHPSFSIVAPGSDPRVRPVCTGPFRFVEYVRQSHLTVERNSGYWGERATLQTLTFRFFPDNNTRVLALRSGEVDAIVDVDRNSVGGLGRSREVQIVSAEPGAVIVMYMATRGPAPYDRLADPVVRRAVAHAIDRTALVERVLDGHAAVVQTVNPPAVLGRYAGLVTGVPYDPAAAARLLEGAGWTRRDSGVRMKGGRPLTLVLIAQPGAVDPAVSQYVQAQLAAVGIGVVIEPLDPGAFQNRLNSGRFDLDIEVPSQNDANPAFLLALRWYPASRVASARFMAIGPSYDTLVEAALAATEHEETQRRAAEAMRLLVDDAVAAVPLAGVYRIYAMKAGVRGFEPHPSKTNQWWARVWLAR